MDEGCGHGAEPEEERTLEPAADSARLHQRRRDHHRADLDEHVAVADVRDVVREHALELRGRKRLEQTGADDERRRARAAAGGKRPWETVRDQVQLRFHDPGNCREPLDRGMEQGRLSGNKLTRADEPEHDPVRVPVQAEAEQEPAEDEDREQLVAVQEPAEAAEQRAQAGEQQPGLQEVAKSEPPLHGRLALVALVFREPARRPVGLGSVAAARAVEGGDVLQRHQDVAVELDVRDVVDGAVRRQDALLIVAAEERHLDLLSLVLARVVVHRGQSSRPSYGSRRTSQLASDASGSPCTASWMRRTDPPCVTTRTRPFGCAWMMCCTASSTRSACAAFVSPSYGRPTSSSCVRPDHEPTSVSRSAGSDVTGRPSAPPTISAVSYARRRSLA